MLSVVLPPFSDQVGSSCLPTDSSGPRLEEVFENERAQVRICAPLLRMQAYARSAACNRACFLFFCWAL